MKRMVHGRSVKLSTTLPDTEREKDLGLFLGAYILSSIPR